MRILGIDPGEKNIGVAISDPTGTLARPLAVLTMTSRKEAAQQILQFAEEEQAEAIIIGQSTDVDGKPDYSGRKAARLAGEIRNQTQLPITLWDESNSTQIARESRIELGVSRKNRQGHLDERAAAVILQSYLDYLAQSA
ncbi:MAG: Holliday junction resolvase RuvX [Anaerolineales bacterium]|jgi:putative Holliday junction resolvase